MGIRTIAFGYPDVGAATIIIRRARDDYYWTGSIFQVDAPSPALDLSYDAILEQYYIDTTPTERSYWTSFDSTPSALNYGEYGGGFPSSVDPGSASTYTMAEIIARIRVQIKDASENLYTDPQLLLILDECNEWLMNQCHLKQATLGVKQSVYTGDGTKEWPYPGDFLGLHYFSNPNLTQDLNLLREIAKAAYDSGQMASRHSGTRFYSKIGNLLYFINDLGTGDTINCYYYPKTVKLDATTTVPYDGKFMSLMVKWGAIQALASDEYSVTFEAEMFGMFMDIAKNYLRREIVPTRVRVANSGGLRNKTLGRARTRRGRTS